MTTENIQKETVLKAFLAHEMIRQPLDCFALKIISQLCADSTLNYYKATLTENEFKNIILPRHDHGINFIPEMGLDIESTCKRFIENEKQNKNHDCFKKIVELKNSIEKNILSENSSFILLSNNKDLVHPDNHYSDYSSDKLFIANGFHRLIAIGLIYFEKNELKIKEYYYGETSK